MIELINIGDIFYNKIKINKIDKYTKFIVVNTRWMVDPITCKYIEVYSMETSNNRKYKASIKNIRAEFITPSEYRILNRDIKLKKLLCQ